MRQTRRQYRDRLPFRSRKIGFEEALARVKREIKRKAVADGVIVDPSKRPPRHEWWWEFGRQNGVVQADTRSQARSLIKTKLNLRKNQRLPAGTFIVKCVPDKSGSKQS